MRQLTLIILLLLGSISYAQLYVGSDTLHVAKGTVFYVDGDLTAERINPLPPVLQLEDSLLLTGNLSLDTGTMLPGAGWLVLTGDLLQQITANPPLRKLKLDNAAGANITQSARITDSLYLYNGKLAVGEYDLTLGTPGADSGVVFGSSDASYVMTTGSGELVRHVAGPTFFPVGNSSYNPALLSLSIMDTAGLRVEDSLFYQYEPNDSQQTQKAVNRAWYLSKGNQENTLDLSLYWKAAEELAQFNRDSSFVSFYSKPDKRWFNDTMLDSPTVVGNLYRQSRGELEEFNTWFSVKSDGPCLPDLDLTTETVCDSYLWEYNGMTYTQTGYYTDTLINIGGCDSVVALDLTVLRSTDSTWVIDTCARVTSASGKYTYNRSGVYYDTIPNAVGCDSLLTYDITINFIETTLDVDACNAYVSPSNKYVWDSSGVYFDTVMAEDGCEITFTVNLTINRSTAMVIDTTVCDSLVTPSGRFLTYSGVFVDTVPNASGCDSVLIYDLTVLPGSQGFTVMTGCDSVLSPSGWYDWSESGIYYDTLTNSVGCDSILLVDLTIYKSSSSSFSVTACDSYTSPSGKYIWTTTGTYQDTIPNADGCDSTMSIQVTINDNSFLSQSVTVCDSYLSPTGKLYTMSGTYYDTLPNAGGCDSIITTNLIVEPVQVTELYLVDANTGADLVALTDGYVINKNLQVSWSIRAEVCDESEVGSVQFFVNGSFERNENIAPYAINGDSGGSFKPWSPAAGTYSVNAIPYSGKNGGGTPGINKMVTIVVVDSLSVDCNGDTAGTAFINDCGECVAGNTGKPVDFGKDDCGVCFGGNADKDCNGDCFGSAVIDSCGDCVLGNTGLPFNGGCNVDCAGVVDGTAFIDDCGICAGGTTGLIPNADKDTCGVCFGNNLSCAPCQPLEVTDLVLVDVASGNDIESLYNGYVINKSALGQFTVRADVCDPDAIGSVRFFLNGSLEQNENKAPYAIAGDNSSGYKPWNVAAGTYNLTVIPFSSSNGNGLVGISITYNILVIDALSVDCNGDTAGTAFINDCGVCVGGTTGKPTNFGKDDCGVCFGNNADKDCNGDCFGSAVIDSCGDCVLGNTGLPFNGGCNVDCAGVVDGTAFIDDCGICAGGNTGLIPNTDKDTCGVCFGNNLSCANCDPNEVVDLVLMNTGTAGPIRSLNPVDTVIRSITGNFSIDAQVCSDPDVESVLFWVNGSLERTENIAPYAIAGDQQGSFRSWNVGPGNYLVTAIPYASNNGNGSQGISKTVDLWVFDTPPARSAGTEVTNPTDGNQSGTRELTEEELAAGIIDGPDMKVYPNPTTGDLNIEITRVTERQAELILLDATGKVIHGTSLEANSSEVSYRLQLAQLPNGVYMIRVNVGDDILTQRVVKE